MYGFTAEIYVSRAILIMLITCSIKIPIRINHILLKILPLNETIKIVKIPNTLIPLHGSPIQTPWL
tara:strand:- start:325 stop:522 length:198 start_codon:yes stop_codon:yes gene_type:complete